MNIDLITGMNYAHRDKQNDVFQWSEYACTCKGNKQNKNVSGLCIHIIYQREREREGGGRAY